ncbi:hypothetical protein PFISCL1PPCAC_17056, partial [Pristionchus fissidentatus]
QHDFIIVAQKWSERPFSSIIDRNYDDASSSQWYVPLMIASWTNCLRLCSSLVGVSSLETAATPRRSLDSAATWDTSVALMRTCRGSVRCSQPGWLSRRASRTGTLTDPRPRTRM